MMVDVDGCPRYVGVVIRGVRVGPSPDWLVRRLEGAGVRSINNIVDVTNFMLLGFGQPMHAFDATRLAGPAIIVRRARPGEKLVTLDGTEGAASLERACATVALAARKQVAHAVAVLPGETLSDGPLLRIVEQMHEASAETQIVVHPLVETGLQHDRRWALLLQQAMAVHADVRILPRWPMPAAGGQSAGTGNG